MTEKRFKQVVDGVKDTRTGRTLTHSLEFTLKLNEINDLYDCVFDRNEELEKENGQLKQSISDWSGSYDGLYEDVKRLEKENEQLKQRNENQYNQLTEVWGLIHRREWEILVDMDNKMKEDEERLQQEWKCYE